MMIRKTRKTTSMDCLEMNQILTTSHTMRKSNTITPTIQRVEKFIMSLV